jgi:hypothetical protein
MELTRTALSRIASLFREKKLDADLEEEMRTHLELAIEENLASGMTAQEARTVALRNFGGVTMAGLLLHSLYGLSRVNPGFDADRVLTAEVSLDATACNQHGHCRNFFNELVRQSRALAGVEGVTKLTYRCSCRD